MDKPYQWLDAYLLAKPGVEKDFKVEWQWDRYMLRGKLYAALCHPEEKYKVYGGHPLVNLKCDPRLAEGFSRSCIMLVFAGIQFLIFVLLHRRRLCFSPFYFGYL